MTVKRVEVSDATESLATYLREADAGPVVVTEAGRPVAALVLLDNTDLETISLSTDPAFLELIQSSRAPDARRGAVERRDRPALEGLAAQVR